MYILLQWSFKFTLNAHCIHTSIYISFFSSDFFKIGITNKCLLSLKQNGYLFLVYYGYHRKVSKLMWMLYKNSDTVLWVLGTSKKELLYLFYWSSKICLCTVKKKYLWNKYMQIRNKLPLLYIHILFLCVHVNWTFN